jgi:Ribonuclease G/E
MIDQTEAMTTIDVNTGSYVGGRSLEDTVFKTNMELREFVRLFEYLLQHYKDQIVVARPDNE